MGLIRIRRTGTWAVPLACLAHLLLFSNVAVAGAVVVRIGGHSYQLQDVDLRYYYPESDKKIQQGTLAGPAAVKLGGTVFRFAAGKQICFHENGSVAWGYLDSPAKARAGGAILHLRRAAGDWELARFHENGTLEAACPAADTELRAGNRRWLFKRPGAEHEMLRFHKNGSVERGCLAKRTAAVIAGRKIDIFSVILFYDNGAIEAAHLAGPAIVRVGKDLVKFEGGEYWQVELFKNGNIERGYLFETVPLSVGGMKVKFQYNALFDILGRVIEGAPAEDFQWKGGVIRASEPVRIDYDGAGGVKSIHRRHHPER